MTENERRQFGAPAPVPLGPAQPGTSLPADTPLDDLVDALAKSKAHFDNALLHAFQQVQYDAKGGVRPLSEERAKLMARKACLDAGLEDPETLRWRLRARIGYRSEED